MVNISDYKYKDDVTETEMGLIELLEEACEFLEFSTDPKNHNLIAKIKKTTKTYLEE